MKDVVKPETRKGYALWIDAIMREEGFREGDRQLGREEAMEEAEEKIREAEEKILAIVRNLKNVGISNEIIAKTVPLSLSEIENL